MFLKKSLCFWKKRSVILQCSMLLEIKNRVNFHRLWGKWEDFKWKIRGIEVLFSYIYLKREIREGDPLSKLLKMNANAINEHPHSLTTILCSYLLKRFACFKWLVSFCTLNAKLQVRFSVNRMLQYLEYLRRPLSCQISFRVLISLRLWSVDSISKVFNLISSIRTFTGYEL